MEYGPVRGADSCSSGREIVDLLSEPEESLPYFLGSATCPSQEPSFLYS